ncbi:MAG: hypothetical protein IKQ46_00795 [Bacteroidales bacterium]|nr:hypothetical protein [Bacteroidales bacterium]
MKFLSLLILLLPLQLFAQDGIKFTFTCQGKPLELNSMQYTSAAGLKYQVSQVQYFVSDISVHHTDGTYKEYHDLVHYVDIEIKNTLTWNADIDLQNADYITFTFGLDSVQNRSYRFKNPPENAMFWPEYLGGGYHYMKTNIMYLDSLGQYNAFNCHLGRGQIYNSDNEPVSYIENSVKIRVPYHANGSAQQPRYATINLDISKLFDKPNAAKFTDYRGIMNNQTAMSLFLVNIAQAFSEK